MNKNYNKGFNIVEELPLTMVNKMLLHAKKKETEQQIYPLWLVHVLMAGSKGEEITSIEKMLYNEETKQMRTKEEILKDYGIGGDIDG